jgi:LPXTG-motif cell wall-anchored protein
VRTIRLAALGTVLALLAALFSAASATAASPGIGTSVVGTTIAQLDLGDVLSARILGDDSIATIDKGVLAVPEAATVLRPLTITSGVLPALNKTIAPVETRSQGAEKRTDYSTDLGNVLLPQLVDGSLTPATLSAIVDAAGARAGLLNELTNLTVGSGLVTVDSITAGLGANAAKESSTSTRGVDVGAISGLNLGALLAGLGLPLNALGLPDIEGLTDELGLLGAGNPVAGLLTTLGIGGAVPTDAASLDTLVTSLDTALDTAVANLASLNATIAGTLGGICGAIPLLDAVALPLGLPSGTTCAAGLTTLTNLVTGAAGDLGGLLSGLLSMLDGMELLNVSGLDVALTSKATDAVGTSVAQVTAAVGDLKVGNLATVPGVDLSATAAQIVGTVDSVTTQLDSVLAIVGLDGLISLSLLDTTGTGVTKTPTGYVRSVSNLTGVDQSIVPPDTLAALVAGLPAAGSSIGGLLTAVPGFASLPALPGTAGMESLNTLLSGASPVDALAGGARLRLASVGGVAEFLPQAAGTSTPTGGTLPRTGGTSDMAGFAIAGVIMAMLGLGIRRRVLAPVRVD